MTTVKREFATDIDIFFPTIHTEVPNIKLVFAKPSKRKPKRKPKK
jgi:hypothetical protein